MANNRIYLLDTKTKECILLLKGYGIWGFYYSMEQYDCWFIDKDNNSASGVEKSSLVLVEEDDLPADVKMTPRRQNER